MSSDYSSSHKSKEKRKHHCNKSNNCCPEYNPCSQTIFPSYVSFRDAANLPYPLPLPPCIPCDPCRCHSNQNKCCRELFCGKYYPCKCTDCGVLMISLNVTTSVPSFSAVNQQIIFTYELRNIGSLTFTKRIVICDELNGTFGVEKATIQKDYPRFFTQTYMTTQEDLNRGYINNISTAYIALNRERYVYSPRFQVNIPFVPV